MPYYINKSTADLHVNIPVWTCATDENFVIEIDYRGNTSGFNRPFGKNTGFVSRLLIRHDSSPGFFLTNDAGTSVSWPLPNGYTATVDAGNFYKMRFVRTAGSVEFFFNGTSQGTRTLTGEFNVERVFIQGGTHDLTNNAIKTLELTKTNNPRAYQGLTGDGTEWTDTISGQHGLVQNPTGTNAEWVLYSDGGSVSSSVSFALPQMSISVNQASLFDSAVSFALPQMSASVSQDSTVPASSSAVSFTLPQMTVVISQKSLFSSSVSFSVPQMTVAAVQKSLFSSTVNVALPQMQVSIAQTPAYSSTVSFTLPQMSVLIIAGDIEYYSTDGANIDLVSLSTHIDVSSRSTHFDVQ